MSNLKPNFKRHKILLPSTKPMQTMVDAGWLIDPPEGKISHETIMPSGEKSKRKERGRKN
ncbi:hypothetical protein LCGC14_1329840 [marine sediment metagenome]|uniref:Uncharacterized protein n=1 Tax=marine sediment metagenome TaxID=412755 RepID=A0A0F9MXT8_9ZZZZ